MLRRQSAFAFLRCGAFAMPFSDLSVIRIYPPVRNHVNGKRNDRVEACFFCESLKARVYEERSAVGFTHHDSHRESVYCRFYQNTSRTALGGTAFSAVVFFVCAAVPEIAAFPAFTGCAALFPAVAQVAPDFCESEQAVKRGSAEKSKRTAAARDITCIATVLLFLNISKLHYSVTLRHSRFVP